MSEHVFSLHCNSMADLNAVSNLLFGFVTHLTTDDQQHVVVHLQHVVEDVQQLETFLDINRKQLILEMFERKRKQVEVICGKHYVFCDPQSVQFYRIKVLQHVDNEEHVFCLFIDFGFESRVLRRNLIVCKDMFSIEPLAKKFFLKGVEVIGEEVEKKNDWKRLKSFLKRMYFFRISYSDNSIELFDLNTREEVLKRFLIHEKFVKEEEERESNLLALDYHNNSDLIDLIGREKSDVTDSVQELADEEVYVEEEEEEGEEEWVDEEEETPRQEEDIAIGGDSSLHSLVNTRHLVYVTHALSSKVIYLQLKETRDEKVKPFEQRMRATRVTMTSSPIKVVTNQSPKNENLVLVFDQLEQKFKRGLMKETEGNLVTVFHVDYGSEEKVDKEECLLMADGEENRFPFAALKAEILNNWNYYQLNKVISHETEVVAHFRSLTDVLEVELIAL